MDVPDLGGLGTTVGTAVAAAAAAYLTTRRKFSRDTAGMVADKAEGNLIAMLISERDTALTAAKEAWAQRTQDAIKIARWETLQEVNEKENIRLRGELFSMRVHVRKLTAIIVRLDPNTAALLNLHDDSDGIKVEEHSAEPAPTGM